MQEEVRSTAFSEQTELEGEHRLPTLRFYGDEFVFNTVSGMFYRVTPTAGFLLHAIDHGARLDALAGLLQRQYSISRAAAVRDVELLLNELTAMEILDQFKQ